MTTRRAGRTSSRRSPKKRTNWEFVNPTGTLAAAGETPVDLTADALIGGDQTGKVLRMVGEVNLHNPGVAGTYGFALGVTIMTADGFVATAVPDPLTDANQGWYYWVATTTRLTPELSWMRTFDIRTQRVIRGGFRLIMIAQASAANPSTMIFSFTARLLWQLD